MSSLLSPLKFGALSLSNRLVMAPLTRARAGLEHIPNALMAEHYAQRASAGLLITDATMVAGDGGAFTAEPGLFDDDRARAWKQVTDAVHARGGHIIVQLWHPGRAAHSSLNGGLQPVSSSNKAIRDSSIHTPTGKHAYEVPRPLRSDELPGIVELFRAAARRSRAAGFDGVQIHGAHGYLIDQFLRDGVNDRRDAYGGSIENRARLLLEIVDACITELGADRVSVRISPLVGFNDMVDSDPTALVSYIATQLDQRGIASLEVRHADQALPEERAIAKVARTHFHGVLLRNGGFDQASGEAALAEGSADAIVYGRLFIANPDLVERFATHADLNELDVSTLYTPGPGGYTDYPCRNAESAA
jgi:N-ethylmaleimide reductase